MPRFIRRFGHTRVLRSVRGISKHRVSHAHHREVAGRTNAIRTEFRKLRVALALLASLVFAGDGVASEIREFDTPTLEKLGNEISRQDELAARADEVVKATHPAARALKMRGWITELGSGGDTVYLIAETASGLCLAYTATFHDKGKPQIEDRRGQALPANVALRFKARETALAAVVNRLFDVPYNAEVLDDPDGSGFLVYFLAASNRSGDRILGGHFRITVSADGSKAEQIDALSHGIIQDKTKTEERTHQKAIVISQLVSDVPVETFIYSSHLFGLPIFVGTRTGTWKVANGRIEKTNFDVLGKGRPARRKPN
jgi:hypothetical protein